MKKYVLWLWRMSAGGRMKIVARAMTGVLNVVVSLTFIAQSKELVDRATAQEGGMLPLMWVLVGCVLLQLLLSVASSRLDVAAGIEMGNRMRNRIFGWLMGSRWQGREALHTADVMNRMNDDIDEVTSLLCYTIPTVIVSGTQLVAAALFLGVLNMHLAIAIVVITPAAFLLSKAYVKRMRSLTHAIRKTGSKLQAFMQEHLQNRMLVVTMEYADRALKGMEAVLQEMKVLVFQRLNYSLFSKCMVQGGFSLGYVMAFLWGVTGLSRGTVSFGMMTAFLHLVAQIQRPILELGKQVPAIVQAMASIDRLMELEALPQEEKGEPKRLDGRIGIRMSQVSFAYTDSGRKVFDHFDYDFQPGSLTAVVGETGVGKSTLIRLLLALVNPNKGNVSFYTAQEEAIVSPMTRCNIVYVPQGNSLVSGTIRDNLYWGNPQATEEELREALHAAVADFVYSLPEGLDTHCGEQGTGLSEGQAQRIAIARGLLRPGGILLLDEPTSSVDKETEKLMLERLSAKMQDKTLILVTHREGIAQLCASTLHLKRV